MDLEDPNKILTIETFNLTAEELIEVINRAGYTAEKL